MRGGSAIQIKDLVAGDGRCIKANGLLVAASNLAGELTSGAIDTNKPTKTEGEQLYLY